MAGGYSTVTLPGGRAVPPNATRPSAAMGMSYVGDYLEVSDKDALRVARARLVALAASARHCAGLIVVDMDPQGTPASTAKCS